MKHIINILFLLCCIGQYTFAQQTPAPPQSERILIMNATAHLGNGKVIKNSVIGFQDGKLTLVADATTARINTNEFDKIIKAQGKHIYPGFIAPNTQIGLREIDAVRATRDDRETGFFNPSVRSLIAYNTDSKVTPTIRSNGVMLAQIVPQGGRISGTSSVIELDAWNWEDAAYEIDNGMHLNWPNAFRRTGWWANPGPVKKNDKYGEAIETIDKFFNEAKAYLAKKEHQTKNLKFESMRGLFDGSKKLYIHGHLATSMMESVIWAEKHGVKPVLVGAQDAWRIKDFLKEHNVPVILLPVHALPAHYEEDIDQPFKTPAILEAAGVTYSFSLVGAWEQRNLVFQAGHAVGYGLDYEDAIKGLTLNPAKILGIDKRVGSLEIGKDATLIISEGDVLDMRTCNITQAFIRGKSIDLDNKQKALYRKFKEKYENDAKQK